MSWGSKASKHPPTAALAPLIVLIVVVGILGFVVFLVAKTARSIAENAEKKLEKKHILISKDGVTVSVKEMMSEKYVDKTQSVLSRAWNLSTWPAYKSRFWNQPQKQDAQKE